MSFKFLVPVSMKIPSYEAFLSDLHQQLVSMGYEISQDFKNVEKYKDYPYLFLTTNYENYHNRISATFANQKNILFLENYNPDLFLAIAAMSEQEQGVLGEYWMLCSEQQSNGVVEVICKSAAFTSIGTPMFDIENTSMFFNIKSKRKATLEEILEYFKHKSKLEEAKTFNIEKVQKCKDKQKPKKCNKKHLYKIQAEDISHKTRLIIALKTKHKLLKYLSKLQEDNKIINVKKI
jgi:hypothetical protein